MSQVQRQLSSCCCWCCCYSRYLNWTELDSAATPTADCWLHACCMMHVPRQRQAQFSDSLAFVWTFRFVCLPQLQLQLQLQPEHQHQPQPQSVPHAVSLLFALFVRSTHSVGGHCAVCLLFKVAIILHITPWQTWPIFLAGLLPTVFHSALFLPSSHSASLSVYVRCCHGWVWKINLARNFFINCKIGTRQGAASREQRADSRHSNNVFSIFDVLFSISPTLFFNFYPKPTTAGNNN